MILLIQGPWLDPRNELKMDLKLGSLAVTGLTISGNAEATETMAEVARLNFKAQPKV